MNSKPILVDRRRCKQRPCISELWLVPWIDMQGGTQGFRSPLRAWAWGRAPDWFYCICHDWWKWSGQNGDLSIWILDCRTVESINNCDAFFLSMSRFLNRTWLTEINTGWNEGRHDVFFFTFDHSEPTMLPLESLPHTAGFVVWRSEYLNNTKSGKDWYDFRNACIEILNICPLILSNCQ